MADQIVKLDKAQHWLEKATAPETDAALRSRISSLRIVCDIHNGKAEGPEASRDLAVEALKRSLQPARPELVAELLAELDCITSRRAGEELETRLMMAAYVKRAKAYPADALRAVVEGWSSKWFPAWAELKDALDLQVRERARILHTLQHNYRANDLDPPNCWGPWSPCPMDPDAVAARAQAAIEHEESRARMAALVRDLFPGIRSPAAALAGAE